MIEQVVLVDTNDQQIGLLEKIEAHQKALLHRAFSVFIFNSNDEMLLQKRASNKYHCAGLWANACCSHPRNNEPILQAATRRLQEEMGFTTTLHPIFNFIYKAELNNGLIEHEFDHVLIGKHNHPIIINQLEVEDYAFKTLQAIDEMIEKNSNHFAPWFLIAYPKVCAWYQLKK